MWDEGEFYIVFDDPDNRHCVIHVEKGDGSQLIPEDPPEVTWYNDLEFYTFDDEAIKKVKFGLLNGELEFMSAEDVRNEILVGPDMNDGGIFMYKDSDEPSVLQMIKDAVGEFLKEDAVDLCVSNISLVINHNGVEYPRPLNPPTISR